MNLMKKQAEWIAFFLVNYYTMHRRYILVRSLRFLYRLTQSYRAYTAF